MAKLNEIANDVLTLLGVGSDATPPKNNDTRNAAPTTGAYTAQNKAISQWPMWQKLLLFLALPLLIVGLIWWAMKGGKGKMYMNNARSFGAKMYTRARDGYNYKRRQFRRYGSRMRRSFRRR